MTLHLQCMVYMVVLLSWSHIGKDEVEGFIGNVGNEMSTSG